MADEADYLEGEEQVSPNANSVVDRLYARARASQITLEKRREKAHNQPLFEPPAKVSLSAFTERMYSRPIERRAMNQKKREDTLAAMNKRTTAPPVQLSTFVERHYSHVLETRTKKQEAVRKKVLKLYGLDKTSSQLSRSQIDSLVQSQYSDVVERRARKQELLSKKYAVETPPAKVYPVSQIVNDLYDSRKHLTTAAGREARLQALRKKLYPDFADRPLRPIGASLSPSRSRASASPRSTLVQTEDEHAAILSAS